MGDSVGKIDKLVPASSLGADYSSAPPDKPPSDLVPVFQNKNQASRPVGPYADPINEGRFQNAYSDVVKRKTAMGQPINKNPDAVRHFYDYRRAFEAGDLDVDATGHGISKWKTRGHPRLIIPDESGKGYFHTKENRPATKEEYDDNLKYNRAVVARLEYREFLKLKKDQESWLKKQGDIDNTRPISRTLSGHPGVGGRDVPEPTPRERRMEELLQNPDVARMYERGETADFRKRVFKNNLPEFLKQEQVNPTEGLSDVLDRHIKNYLKTTMFPQNDEKRRELLGNVEYEKRLATEFPGVPPEAIHTAYNQTRQAYELARKYMDGDYEEVANETPDNMRRAVIGAISHMSKASIENMSKAGWLTGTGVEAWRATKDVGVEIKRALVGDRLNHGAKSFLVYAKHAHDTGDPLWPDTMGSTAQTLKTVVDVGVPMALGVAAGGAAALATGGVGAGAGFTALASYAGNMTFWTAYTWPMYFDQYQEAGFSQDEASTLALGSSLVNAAIEVVTVKNPFKAGAAAGAAEGVIPGLTEKALGNLSRSKILAPFLETSVAKSIGPTVKAGAKATAAGLGEIAEEGVQSGVTDLFYNVGAAFKDDIEGIPAGKMLDNAWDAMAQASESIFYLMLPGGTMQVAKAYLGPSAQKIKSQHDQEALDAVDKKNGSVSVAVQEQIRTEAKGAIEEAKEEIKQQPQKPTVEDVVKNPGKAAAALVQADLPAAVGLISETEAGKKPSRSALAAALGVPRTALGKITENSATAFADSIARNMQTGGVEEVVEKPAEKTEPIEEPPPVTEPPKPTRRIDTPAILKGLPENSRVLQQNDTEAVIEVGGKGGAQIAVVQSPDEAVPDRAQLEAQLGRKLEPDENPEDFQILGSTRIEYEDGTNTPAFGVIELNEQLQGRKLTETARHEILHVGRKLGLITPAEWGKLVDDFSDSSKGVAEQEEDIAKRNEFWGKKVGMGGKLKLRFKEFVDNLLTSLGIDPGRFRYSGSDVLTTLSTAKPWQRTSQLNTQTRDMVQQAETYSIQVRRSNIGDHLSDIGLIGFPDFTSTEAMDLVDNNNQRAEENTSGVIRMKRDDQYRSDRELVRLSQAVETVFKEEAPPSASIDPGDKTTWPDIELLIHPSTKEQGKTQFTPFLVLPDGRMKPLGHTRLDNRQTAVQTGTEYGFRVKESIGAGKGGTVDRKTYSVKRRLANYGRSPEARGAVEAVDEAMEATGYPGRRTRQSQIDLANEALAKDYEGEKRRLIEEAKSGLGEFREVDHHVANELINREFEQAWANNDQDALADFVAIAERLRTAKTEIARTLGVRDPTAHKTDPDYETKLAMQDLVKLVTNPTAIVQRKIDRATAEGDLDEADRLRVEHATTEMAAVKKDLEAFGISFNPTISPTPRVTGTSAAAEPAGAVGERPATKKRKPRKKKADTESEAEEVTEGFGLRDNMSDADRAAAIMRIISVRKASFWDKLFELRSSLGLLSGPKTILRNWGGNTLNAGYHFTLKRVAAALINTAVRNPKAAQWGELKYILPSMISAQSRLAHNFIKTFMPSMPYMPEELKAVTLANEAWRREVPSLSRRVGGPEGSRHDAVRVAIGGHFGRFVRGMGYRHLLWADEYAKSVIAQTEVVGQAFRIAKAEKAPDMALRIQELVDNTESEAWKEALDTAVYLTFQKEGSKLARAGLTLRKIPGVRHIIPYVTTPSNILYQGMRNTPLGILAMAHKWVTGEYEGKGEDVVDHAAEQLLSGMAIMAMWALLWNDDDDDDDKVIMTGSLEGSNYRKRMQSERQLPANSLIIGDNVINYGTIEPFATSAATIIDYTNAVRHYIKTGDTKGIVNDPIESFVGLVHQKSFLKGLSDIARAVDGEEPGRGMLKWSASFASSWIPNIARTVASSVRESRPTRSVWPEEGEVGLRQTFIRAYQKAEVFPEIWESVPQIDIWGRERPVNTPIAGFSSPVSDMLWRGLNPLYTKKLDIALGDQVLMHWNETATNPVRPVVPRNEYLVGKETKRFTDQQYHDYLKLRGEVAGRLVDMIGPRPDNPDDTDLAIVKWALSSATRATKIATTKHISDKKDTKSAEYYAKRIYARKRSSMLKALMAGIPELPTKDRVQKWKAGRAEARKWFQRIRENRKKAS